MGQGAEASALKPPIGAYVGPGYHFGLGVCSCGRVVEHLEAERAYVTPQRCPFCAPIHHRVKPKSSYKRLGSLEYDDDQLLREAGG